MFIHKEVTIISIGERPLPNMFSFPVYCSNGFTFFIREESKDRIAEGGTYLIVVKKTRPKGKGSFFHDFVDILKTGGSATVPSEMTDKAEAVSKVLEALAVFNEALKSIRTAGAKV